MKKVRLFTDNLFQGLIRLCMLTGVTFLVTACYGPYPERSGSAEYDEEMTEIEEALEDSLVTNEQGRD